MNNKTSTPDVRPEHSVPAAARQTSLRHQAEEFRPRQRLSLLPHYSGQRLPGGIDNKAL